jgi:hypothetical protein
MELLRTRDVEIPLTTACKVAWLTRADTLPPGSATTRSRGRAGEEVLTASRALFRLLDQLSRRKNRPLFLTFAAIGTSSLARPAPSLVGALAHSDPCLARLLFFNLLSTWRSRTCPR